MELSSEEEQLVRDAVGGNVSAFEELVRKFEGFVFAVISKHGPRDEAESVAQEVFIAAFKSLPSLRETAAFPGWLHGIALRRCRDYWRKFYRQARRETAFSSIPAGVVEGFAGPENLEARAQAGELLNQVLGSLSADDRMIMTLLYLEERPVREVAELMGLSQVNVKVRAHRVRKRLERQLQESEAKER